MFARSHPSLHPVAICVCELASALAGIAAVGLLFALGVDPFADDAYLSLRYARNLVDGQGLVFNPGQRVEGFTHPLWVLFEAAVLATGLAPKAALEVAGVASWLALSVLLARTADRAGVGPRLRFVPGLVVAGSASGALWALSGLETTAHALLFFEGVRRMAAAVVVGRTRSLDGALVLGAATLLRPETAPVAVVLAVTLPWGAVGARGSGEGASGSGRGASGSGGGAWARASGALFSLAAYAAVLAPWQVFRLVYYRAWLPNTFYAKVEPFGWAPLLGGLDYLREASLRGPLGLLLFVLALRSSAFARPGVRVPALAGLVYLAEVALVGGDYFWNGRFVLPALAPLALACASACAPGSASAGTREADARAPSTWLARIARAAFVVAPLAGLLPYLGPDALHRSPSGVARYERAGAWLAKNLPPEALVATPAAGAVGYLGRTRVLDEYGLTNRFLALHRDARLGEAPSQEPPGHARGNASYVLLCRPDVILLGNVWIDRQPMTLDALRQRPDRHSITDRLLLADPAFYRQYELVSYPLSDGLWFGMAVARGSSLLPALEAAPVRVSPTAPARVSPAEAAPVTPAAPEASSQRGSP